MSVSKTALIFGAGSNIGAGLTKGFLGAGYRVATVSRRSNHAAPTPGDNDSVLPIQADLSDPAAVPGVYARVADAGWAFPAIVVWNAASLTRPDASDPENPLEVPLDGFDADLGLMVRSPYVAAREAVRGWRDGKVPPAGGGGGERKGTFVMTGNLLPRKIVKVPALVDVGVGKAGANYWVGLSDAIFREEGIRFFFADERKADGSNVGSKPDGDGYARLCLDLVKDDKVPYYVTFVDGKYKEFST
ncbi:unnamed protein product [Discula destructiva]